ncbi:hypothetical protein [Burkholderia cepacia]|uniref:hypothetical protein n=1 Tax=Burkholderia cepacia TaxID=292 RepID=UPI0026519961|nr:hypothetical protein [Burkholderia cepacia]MDN7635371.1 hypothetical protein [Burkholderia cepacia]
MNFSPTEIFPNVGYMTHHGRFGSASFITHSFHSSDYDDPAGSHGAAGPRFLDAFHVTQRAFPSAATGVNH